MPTNFFTYPNSYSCVSNDSYTRSKCLPLRSSCNPMDTCGLFINEIADAWNCNICGADEKFCIPYAAGDKIPLQVYFPDFVNVLPATALTAGWFGSTATPTVRVQLYDLDGVLVTQNVTALASEYVVGFNDNKAYQSIVIDTTLTAGLGVDCFYLRFNNFLSDGITEDKYIFTEPFCLTPNCDLQTVQIQGTYSGYDCQGFYYGTSQRLRAGADGLFIGTSDFAHTNTMRYFAEIQETGGTVEKTSFGTRSIVTRSVINQNYRLQFTKKVPPYIMCIFLKQHFAAKTFLVDGIEYIANGTVQNQINTRASKMFLINVSVQKNCDNRFACD